MGEREFGGRGQRRLLQAVTLELKLELYQEQRQKEESAFQSEEKAITEA